MDRSSGDIQTLIAANEQALEDGIGDVLKVKGYRKKKRNWYLETDETVRVVNLQKSSWGPQFYVNLGISIKSLDPAREPAEYKCHVRDRLAADSETERALNAADESMSSEARRRIVHDVLQNFGIPFLDMGSSLAELIRTYRDGQLADSKLTVSIRKVIEEQIFSTESPVRS